MRTANELKAEQEKRIRSYYKEISSNVMFAETQDEAIQALKGEKFSNAEIMRVIDAQGTSEYGKKALDRYTKEYVALRAQEIQTQYKGMSTKEAKQKAEAEAVQAFAKLNYSFFYPKLLGLRSDEVISNSYNDQTYDIDRLREKYGANLEGLKDILPKEALGTHRLYSVDVMQDNGVIEHRIVLDVNDSSGVDKGDKVLETWTGNDRGGATGSQSTITYDREKGITVNSYASGASNYK